MSSLQGKNVLVTGATSGIGRETALGLLQRGARVGIVGRDRQRLAETKSLLEASVPGGRVDTFLADLSLRSEVRRLAGEVVQAFPELHVLVNNAGAIFSEHGETAEGLERTFALNHLSYFLLTDLLLPLLKKSAPARIVNVASDAHRAARLDLDDLQSRRSYSAFRVYGTSKLMNILFTRELSRRLEGSGVTANCLHPGVIATGFGHNTSGLFNLFVRLGAPFLSTPAKGARTSIHLASADEVAEVSGEYFANCKVARTRAKARDDQAARRLWDESVKLVAG
jgi:NAD(P)-dependent dehydrogenase (short-subunit alcohol dehydrogenase family)